MRELSEQEKQFIKSTITENTIVEKTNGKVKRKKNKKRSIFKNIYFWISCIMVLSVLLSGMVLLSMVRLQVFFGSDVVTEMSRQQMTPDIKKRMNDAGMGWIPQALSIYKHQGMIIASIFTTAIILSLLIYIINLLLSNRSIKNKKAKEIKNDQ